MAKVLIAIVSTGDDKWLFACLSSLSTSIFTDFDVMLIVNNSLSGYSLPPREYDYNLIIHESEELLGFAQCNNIAFEYARSNDHSYLMLLNPDTILHPHALSKAIPFLDENKDYGIVGCHQIDYSSGDWTQSNEWMKETMEEASSLGSQPHTQSGMKIINHYYVQGAAMIVRMELIPSIGYLDPVYGTFYEETDLCRRCSLSGNKIALLLESKVKHYEGGHWKKNKVAHYKRDRLFLRNQFLFLLSDPLKRSFLVQFALIVLNQTEAIIKKQKNIILSIYHYPSILLSVVTLIPTILKMRVRNLKILNAAKLCEWELAIH